MFALENNVNLVRRNVYRQIQSRIHDGDLFHTVLQRSDSLYKKTLLAHYGCINALEFSPDGSFFVSGGDDKRVLIWKLSNCMNKVVHCPPALAAEHRSNIFCLAVTKDCSMVLSGGNDEQVIVHDLKTNLPLDYHLHERQVYSISASPVKESIFASACEDGKVRVFDIRLKSSDCVTVARRDGAFHAVHFNPVDDLVLATANVRRGVELWDLRVPRRCLLHYPSNKEAMDARFSQNGTRLLCLYRKDCPIVYNVCHPQNSGVRLKADGYLNWCTMKSCCYAGDGDEYAVSGSDDHNIYVWKLPLQDCQDTVINEPHVILRGHRSIVNQVRYNPSTCMLASCGVEKLIQLWSPLYLPNGCGGLEKAATEEIRASLIPMPRPSNNIELIFIGDHQPTTNEDSLLLEHFDMLVSREVNPSLESREIYRIDLTGTSTPSFSYSSDSSGDSSSEASNRSSDSSSEASNRSSNPSSEDVYEYDLRSDSSDASSNSTTSGHQSSQFMQFSDRSIPDLAIAGPSRETFRMNVLHRRQYRRRFSSTSGTDSS